MSDKPSLPTPAAPALCDLETGVCQIATDATQADSRSLSRPSRGTVHYVGDPMCSWCWGISPSVKNLESYCRDQGIAFSITLGGLRAGGGDAWNGGFKDFLRKEWSHIQEVTGQPFSMALLERAHFNYDTEPACRAIVAVRAIVPQNELAASTTLAFFSAVQHKFYVEGADPKDVTFYRDICASLAIDFDTFAQVFCAPATVAQTAADFARCRQMGVNAFPSIMLEVDGQFSLIGRGFTTEEQLLTRLRAALALD